MSECIASTEYFKSLAARIESAGHGQRGVLIQGAQNMLSMSRQQIYRNLQKVGWRSCRKVRADKGDSDITDDELRFIVNLMLESTRENKKQLLTWEDAVSIAQANGHVKSQSHPATYSRVARERGFHPDQLKSPTPHQDMKSLHPNHVWQFDVSLCVLYYMDDDGLEPMDKKRFYQNKPQYMEKIKKKRCLRYLVTDHTSGAMYLKYYVAAGEDQETLFEFLMDAFAASDHPQDPFHGVPWVLIWDAGAANQSHLIKNLLQQLGVQHWHHMPGVPRAKGQVEGGHNIVERSFEGRLSMMNIRNIDELNAAAGEWMRWFNGTKKHRRHGHTRYQQWQTIREGQLRLCPDRVICEALLQTKPEQRQVKGNLTISYKVKGFEASSYSVAHVPDIRVGDMVTVCVNPYHAPNIYVIEAGEHADNYISCEPLSRDENGFMSDATVWMEGFASKEDTESNKRRKSMLKEAYGTDTQLGVDQARAKREPTFNGHVDPITYMGESHQTDYMKRKGTTLNVPDRVSVEIQAMTMTAAIKQLINEHGITVDKSTRKLLADWYPDGIFETDLPDAAQRLNGWTEENIGLRLVK